MNMLNINKTAVQSVKTMKSKWQKWIFTLSVAVPMSAMLALSASANMTVTEATADPEQTFKDLIKFFAGWIGYAGLLVMFVGAIQFGLAIKNEDADVKSRATLTIIAGAVVFAITKSLSLFGF
ncbi:hypothetical protein FACS189499_07420 [Clostridia bacterium]|nr:hypothetical protein FACS189499_07420 [Clostridia bacterium]